MMWRVQIVGPRTVALLLALLAVSCDGDESHAIPPSNMERYSLLTWTSRNSELCFALMPIGERADFLRRWYPKRGGRCGLPDLRSAIEALPDDVAVIWEDIPDRGFTYPAARIMDEVREFAKTQGVTVVFAPVLIE